MDVVSHALVGALCQSRVRLASFRLRVIVSLFAVLPDLPLAFVYILLGREKGRPLWIPHNADWVGVRTEHPYWSAVWEMPHSLFFVLLVVLPVVLHFRVPKAAIISYLSHIPVDILTHTGEWAVKPFYPLDLTLEGFTDAWAWPIPYFPVSWVVLTGLLLVIRPKSRRTGAASDPEPESQHTPRPGPDG